MSAPFTGTRHLVRLVLRRDRIRLPIWVGAITAVTGLSASAVQGFYNTPEKIAGYQATVTDSVAGLLMNGRPVGVDAIAGITAYETTMQAYVVVALMAVFTVIRHTRAEEETGRAELLRATVTGRHAATLAAVLVAGTASLLVGLLDTAVLLANDLPTDGSVLHGLGVAGVGLAFTGLAACAAQITSAARGATGIALSLLGVTFLMRGLGDVGENWLTWTSPLGWAQGVQPYADPQPWLLLPLAALVAVLFAAATYLTLHRDAGSGLIHPRPGRPRATRMLGTAVGFPLRLQRGTLIGWGVGLFLGAVLFGSVGPEVQTLVESNPELADYFGGDSSQLLDSFFASMMVILAVVSCGFGVSSALRLHTEETSGRAEPLLATGLSRTGWVLGFLTVTVLGSLTHLALIGAGNALGYGLAAQDWSLTGSLMASALALAPAVLAVVAAAVLLQGLLPRFALAAWAVLAFAFVESYLGPLLKLPAWLASLSPFHHLPLVPLESFDIGAATGVLAAALAVAALGLVGFRRRDLG